MQICRVVGDVVSTVKNRALTGEKLLIVRPVDLDQKKHIGREMIAVDHVQAGPGDLVLVNREGGSAREVIGKKDTPAQAVIVAVIDDMDVQES